MSEEFSAGVRIVLERAKSNPEEMGEEFGKWSQLREAIFECKERGIRNAWTRGFTEEEIDALYDSFCSCHRKTFDDWVMQQVLVEENVEQGLRESQVPQRVFTETQLKSRMKGVDRHGTWDNVTNQMSNTSLGNLVHGLNQGRK
jgi:hypothetical protein